MSSDQQLALARATTGQSTHLSKTARQVVPPFLQKLYEIVNDPKNDELIRWSESGDSFYVLNHERFAREVLGRWFKHQKFTSFVRQLNMYGFHKIPHLQQGVLRSESDTEPWHFEHPHFHRGQPDLLCLIQRKKQPQQSNLDDMHLDMHDSSAHISPQLGNLSQGQILDINSVVNGIAAIKRHQQAISVDLSELKASNQHLWQEALAARERHKKHQDTINRILKFLAGVFGHGAEHKHEGSPDSIQRKRPRLMIGDSQSGEKRKAAVDEVIDDDDKRSLADQTASFARVETPETTMNSPSLAPSDAALSPSASDITFQFSGNNNNGQRGTENVSRANNSDNSVVMNAPVSEPSIAEVSGSPVSQDKTDQPLNSVQAAMAALGQNPQQASPEMWATFQQMLNSPNSMHKLMQALANQQAYPMAMPEANNITYPPDNTIGAVAPYSHYNSPYPNTNYDWSRFKNPELPPYVQNTTEINNAPSTIAPGAASSLTRRDSEDAVAGGSPLDDNSERLHKAYEDAAQIDADVDALQYSINSLIENLGLDPSSIIPLDDSNSSNSVSLQTHGTGKDTPSSDPTVDFDFDAFFNELSSRQPPPMPTDYQDMVDATPTARFDPVTSIDPSGVDDAQQEQLTAFLEDAGTSSLVEKHSTAIPVPPVMTPSVAMSVANAAANAVSAATATAKKRKSDVSELPAPVLLNEEVPKTKRRR